MFNKVGQTKVIGLYLCSVLLALIIEGLVFNHMYFRYHMGNYQEHNVELPYNKDFGSNLFIYSSQNQNIELDNLNFKLFSIALTFQGPQQHIKGKILINDDASLIYKLVANEFIIHPTVERDFKVFVKSNGNIRSINVLLENIQMPVALTKLVLNPNPNYYFSFLRFFLMLLFFSATVTVFNFKLYELRLSDLTKRQYVIGQIGSMSLCIIMACYVFDYNNPHRISPNTTFYFSEGQTFGMLGNKEQSWLIDFPTNVQELRWHDPYVRTMDAMFKGQLNLDVNISQELLNTEHPYDRGVREQIKAGATWDQSFYNGKYYSYYGYAPIFSFYMPLYLLTGKVPALAFINFVLAISYILSFYLASHMALKFFNVNANAMILLLGEIGLIFGSHLYFNQTFTAFYAIAVTLSSTYLFLAIAAAYKIAYVLSATKRRCLLAFIGLAVVMIVLSRPLNLLFVIIGVTPVLWYLLKAKVLIKNSSLGHMQFNNNIKSLRNDNLEDNSTENEDNKIVYSLKEKVIDFLCFAIPTTIGAIFTMVTNYKRFDSIFEFGQRYCTGLENFTFNEITFSFDHLWSVIYLYFMQGFEYLKAFPYVAVTNDTYNDLGNFFYMNNPLGLFASPIWYSLFLIIPFIILFKISKKSKNLLRTKWHPKGEYSNNLMVNSDLVLSVSVPLMLLALLFVLYVASIVANFTVRYTFEALSACAVFCLILMCLFIDYSKKDHISHKIFFVIAIMIILKTIVLDFFAMYSLNLYLWPDMTVDYFLIAREFFSPLTTLR